MNRVLFSATISGLHVDKEVRTRTHELMKEEGLSYTEAFRMLLASDRDLAGALSRGAPARDTGRFLEQALLWGRFVVVSLAARSTRGPLLLAESK